MQKIILFYINQIYEGGAERVIVNLANYFAEAGYKSILLTSFRHEGEYSLSEKVQRISVEEEEKKDSRLKKNIRRTVFLRRTVKKCCPDLIVSFMTEPIIRTFVATAGLQTKRLISVRSDPKIAYKSGFRRLVGRTLFSMADACVFQTDEAKEWFPRRLQNKSKIIYNPIDEGFYRLERKPVMGRIVSCGRLTPIKNQKMLIEAFYEVQKKMPATSLEIYGEGKLRQELQLLIDGLGISNKVFLKGQTSDVKGVLSQAEMFVLTSDAEGMPNALQEALAAGVPCISTDCPCGGPATLIEDGYNGKLCETGNVAELADSMLELLENRQKMEAMGKVARKMAKMFSADEVYREWEDYIVEVVGK